MKAFSYLSQPNIREEKVGLSQKQYDLFEHLGEYFNRVVSYYDLGIISTTKMESGTLSAVVRVESAQQRFVVKISAREDLESEAFFLEQAELHGIDAPTILKVDFSKKIIPFDYVFLEFLDGKLPSALPSPILFRVGYIFGKNLAIIHSIHARGVGSIRNNCYTHDASQWQQLLIQSLKQRFEEVSAFESRFSKKYQLALEQLLERDEMKDFDPRLLHGDVGGNNYLVQLRAQKWVTRVSFIDPGTWVGGDPMQDLAFSQMSWNYPGFSDGVMKGYVHIHPLSEKEFLRFRILHIFNEYWGALISCKRSRERFKDMFQNFQKLLADFVSSENT